MRIKIIIIRGTGFIKGWRSPIPTLGSIERNKVKSGELRLLEDGADRESPRSGESFRVNQSERAAASRSMMLFR